MKPKFSVIIPSHGRLHFLREAIDSIIQQSYLPLEVMVVDDIPSVDTQQLVKSYERKTSVLMRYVVNTEKPGALRSRNLGIKYSTGTHLAFIDDDDTWKADYLEKIAAVYEQDAGDATLVPFLSFDENMTIKEDKTPPVDFRVQDYYLQNLGALCTNFTISREVYDAIGGYDEGVFSSADKDIAMNVSLSGYRVHVLTERLAMRRVSHADQWSADGRSIRKGVVLFYKKYFFRMSPLHHALMLLKILKLYVKP
ncbi:MAG: glycosyltransferase family 2 protein [Desulfovibrio sp.]